jgi:hypothetical protein
VLSYSAGVINRIVPGGWNIQGGSGARATSSVCGGRAARSPWRRVERVEMVIAPPLVLRSWATFTHIES